MYTPPPSAWKTWPKPRETNEESLPLRIDEGSWTCISERCLTFFHFFEKFFESVFGCSFSFFLERMRVEYLTVQRALLPDSRIILELLVEFIDMILCIIIQYKLYEFDTSCSLKHDKFNPLASGFFHPLSKRQGLKRQQEEEEEEEEALHKHPSVCFVHSRISFPSQKGRCVRIERNYPTKHRSTVSIKHGNHSGEDDSNV